MIEPHRIKEVSEKYTDDNMKFRVFLKNRADSEELDQQFRDLHNEIFIRDKYDCCKCASCCKLYGIRVELGDIPATAGYRGQTESGFIETYLTQAENLCNRHGGVNNRRRNCASPYHDRKF